MELNIPGSCWLIEHQIYHTISYVTSLDLQEGEVSNKLNRKEMNADDSEECILCYVQFSLKVGTDSLSLVIVILNLIPDICKSVWWEQLEFGIHKILCFIVLKSSQN